MTGPTGERRTVGGRYELTTLIGQGGMGQVWTAQDLLLGREVAVKLLRATATSGTHTDELRRRFERESRVTARVAHPGLVTVHDAGTDTDELYLVMQYVRGCDLADHLAENDPYPWPWAVAVATQLCAVLAAVHEAGVVHRDLKPRNLMLRHDGTLVVLDLGVAAVLGTDTTRVTATGSPVGSPAYMSPEQAMGGQVGPASDLYSLGVVLHELLSGTIPFEGSSALGTLHRHLHEPPRPLRQVRPDLPPTLETLVLWLLAKEPAQRPTDAHAVYQALAPLRPGPQPAHAPTASGPSDPTRPFRLPFAPWPDRTQPAATPLTDPVPVHVPAGHGTPVPDPEADLLTATVDEARRLLRAGQINQALGLLVSALRTAEARHGVNSPVATALRRQYAALQPHVHANGAAGATPHRP